MQATRGTSLSAPDQPRAGAGEARPVRGAGPSPTACKAWFAAIAVVGLAADQITKYLAEDRLADGGRVDLVGDLLGLRLVHNPGAAFSTGTGFTEVFAVLAVVATVVVAWFARRLGDRLWSLGLGFIMAGVVGNLTDRVFRDPGPMRGHVVDFLELPNWPIFNLADVWLNIGVGLVILQTLRGIQLAGGRVEQPDAT